MPKVPIPVMLLGITLLAHLLCLGSQMADRLIEPKTTQL